MLNNIDSLEASFQRIELTINRMCGLFGRPEEATTDLVSSPPLAEEDDDGSILHPLLSPEEDRLSSLARRARSHAERIESCCQDLQDKYEQVAAIEQKLERSSVIWKVAIQKLTELLTTQRAQLTLLKHSHSRTYSMSSSLSPPPLSSSSSSSSSISTTTNVATTETSSTTPPPTTTSSSTSSTSNGKGSQKGTRKLRRRGSETLHDRNVRNSRISYQNGFDISDYDNESDDSNLRNALEIMWKVERAKKEAQEALHPSLFVPHSTAEFSNAKTLDLNGSDMKIGGGNGSNGNGIGGNTDNSSNGGNSAGNGDDVVGGGDDDIEQMSATVLGNIVVLDEIMSEISNYRSAAAAAGAGGASKKVKGKKRGDGPEGDVGGSTSKPVEMVNASVQTDPLEPEQLRSLLDSMVLTHNQEQGCNIQ